VTRPSEAEVDEALQVVSELIAWAGRDHEILAIDGAQAHDVLYRASRPRVLWLSTEVAEALGVADGNVLRTDGLPAPVQTLPRPTKANPDRVLRHWDREQVLEFAAMRRERTRR
jgi:hypothetical protein